MNTKGNKQKKIMKNRIKINKEYQKYFINNIRKNKNKSNKKSLKSILVTNNDNQFNDNIYQFPLTNNYIVTDNKLYNNHLYTENNNINSFNNIYLNNFNIINQKKPQMKINPTDQRLIYCIKMLGITKYYSNFVQKKINFEEFLFLSNNDMTEMKIPENIQKLIKEFSMDYLYFGNHDYTLDELKSYFSTTKKFNFYNNNKAQNNKEKESYSFDFNQKQLSKNNKIINLNNINYMNNNFQKRNIINNYISNKNRNHNVINKNIIGYNMNYSNRRINKSASPSKRNNYINKINMKDYDIQNNLNIIEPSFSGHKNNINQYNNNINFTTKNERKKSYSKLFNFDEGYSSLFNNMNNFNLVNKKKINQINNDNDNDNNFNYENFDNSNYNYNNNTSNARQLLKKYNMKTNKSSDNLYINNYNKIKASLNPRNIYNEIVNSKMNEKPFINNDLYKNNLKSKDFFNTYMNKNNNIKVNNINSDSYCNTQIISNRLENDICENNMNKNKFLDRLASPLLNQRKNKIDFNKEQYNQFRVKKIIANNYQPNLYNSKKRNNFLLNGLISNEESNYKNINNYENNISLNNVGNYNAIKSAYSENNNYINPNNLNLINMPNYKNQSIKNRAQSMQRKSYSDVNFKTTQYQKYNSLNNNNGNNNICNNDKISHITYSEKKRKYNQPHYTNSLTNYNINQNNIDIKNKRSINLSKQINKNKLNQMQINLNDFYNENNNFITNNSNQLNNNTLKMNHSKTLNSFYPYNINDDNNLRNYLEDQNNFNYYLNNNIDANNIY